jgi:hypothetical protein
MPSNISVPSRVMQIVVRGLDGHHFMVKLACDERIDSLKARILQSMRMDPARLMLICNGKVLTRGTLMDYAVTEHSTIQLASDLIGGSNWDT